MTRNGEIIFTLVGLVLSALLTWGMLKLVENIVLLDIRGP